MVDLVTRAGKGAPLTHPEMDSNWTNIKQALDQKAAADHGHSGVYEPANANIQAHVTATGNPHSTTAQDVGAIPASEKGLTVATLVNGTVPSSQLPSFVDDVLEYANLAAFPATGESGKIYIAINGGIPADPSVQYRWSGSGYVSWTSSPGSTDSVVEGGTNLYFTATRVLNTVLSGLSTLISTDVSAADTILVALGKLQRKASDLLTALTNHTGSTSNPHSVTKVQVGLQNVDNTSDLDKPISTATQNALNGKAASTHNHDAAYQVLMAAATQAEMVAGTEVGLRSMSPVRVAQAIAALGGSGGVGRNLIINGEFQVAQTGTTYSLTNMLAIGAIDRWAVQQQTSPAGIANRVASGLTGFQYAMKLGRTAGSALTGAIVMQTGLTTPDSVCLAGKQVTLSFWAKAGANFSAVGSSIVFDIVAGKGTNQTIRGANNILGGAWATASTVAVFNQAITTSWVRYSITGTVPADATQVGVLAYYAPTGTAGADDNIYITGVKLEEGAVATAWLHRRYDKELRDCQAYRPVKKSNGTAAPIGPGFVANSSTGQATLSLPVTPRVDPTDIVLSSPTHLSLYTSANYPASTVAFAAACDNVVTLNLGITGATASQGGYVYFNNASGMIVFDGCEL